MIEKGRFCYKCEKVEFFDLKQYSQSEMLKEYKGNKLCNNCLIEVFQRDNPDPTDKNSKYQLNKNELKWEKYK